MRVSFYADGHEKRGVIFRSKQSKSKVADCTIFLQKRAKNNDWLEMIETNKKNKILGVALKQFYR